MSYESRDSQVLGRQLDVQEVCVGTTTPSLYTVSGGDIIVHIGETIKSMVLAMQKDDSANDLVHFDAADLVIQTNGTDVLVTGCVLAANDCLILKYIVAR